MSRKFKLIQEYPGNKNVGSVYSSVGTDAHDEPNINCLGKNITPTKWPKYFEEVKEPLFTTDDGVDIYYGERYWYVDGNFTHGDDITRVSDPLYYQRHAKSTMKRFSSAQIRDIWIEENEPKFSLKDVENAVKDGTFYNGQVANFIDDLKKKLVFHKKGGI